MISTIYRISPEQFLANLSGRGGSYQDGARWNPAGYPVIYMAFSASTAMLEMANYVPHPSLVPKDYKIGEYEIPTDLIDIFDQSKLPEKWADFPHSSITQDIGKEWLDSGSNLALKLPSCCVPNGLDCITLINANHPQIDKIKLISITDMRYNERTFSGMDS